MVAEIISSIWLFLVIFTISCMAISIGFGILFDLEFPTERFIRKLVGITCALTPLWIIAEIYLAMFS